MLRSVVLSCLAALVFSSHSPTLAQYICGPQWLEGLPPVDGDLYGSTTWDPDGDGPASPLLIVGGAFATAGGVAVSNIAAFNGTAWSALGDGTNGVPWAFAEYNGDLVVGGRFTMAGGVPCSYVARWDGTAWHAMGDNLNSFVYALAVYNGELYAGGVFLINGQQSVARWDGAGWQPVGGGMAIYDCPVNWCGTGVYALRVFNGELVAGGYFTQAGGIGARYIARWDGYSWHSLGGGLDYQVEALTEHNGKLIVGGHFSRASYNSVATNRIAVWGPGWSALGEGLNKAVWALASHNGKLYAGGAFTASGETPMSRLAVWNDTGWSEVGAGVDSTVLDLSVYDGDLVPVGHFASVGGVPSSHWARWRETPPPRILTQPTAATVTYGECAAFSVSADGEGTLQYAWLHNSAPITDNDRVQGAAMPQLEICPANKTDMGWYAVKITDECGSTDSAGVFLNVLCPGGIETQPQSQTSAVGGEAQFFVMATGVGTLQYQWRRGGVPVADDARFSGANTPELRISPVLTSDGKGTYSVSITDDCGSRTSNSATLTVTCPSVSPADFNRDCDVDLDDIAIFRTCAAGAHVPFNTACPRWPNDRSRAAADFDLDGDVDADDFGSLQRCFSGSNVPPPVGCAN